MQSTSELSTACKSDLTEKITTEGNQEFSEDRTEFTPPSLSNRKKPTSPLDNLAYASENSASSTSQTERLLTTALASNEAGNIITTRNKYIPDYHTDGKNKYQPSKIPSTTNDDTDETTTTTHLTTDVINQYESLFNLGLKYIYGDDVEINLTEAFNYISMAAKQGNISAQYTLGVMYTRGMGVDIDLSKAFEWIEKAALEGGTSAQYVLGVFYNEGHGVPHNSSEAFKWFQKAALQDHAIAQFNVGVMYDQGEGVDQNSSKAFDWYLKAALHGHALAQLKVGKMYNQGKGVDQNSSEAFKWFQKAALQDHAVAQFNVGMKYDQGEGVEQNSSKAFDWYLKAALHGHALAQLKVGEMYNQGKGVYKDLSKSAHWLLNAAEAGLQKAQLALAQFFVSQNTIGQDLFKATYWLLRSGLSDDKKTIRISLIDFSKVIALIPSALNENKEFEKESSIEFLKIPKEAHGKMGPIFAELMKSSPNLTSLKAPDYVIDDNEARLIKKSLDINTAFNEISLNYNRLDNPKNSFENLKKMVWNTLSHFLKFYNSIKNQLLDASNLNQTIF